VRVYSEVETELLLDINSWYRSYMTKYLAAGLKQHKYSFDSGPARVRLVIEW